MRLSSSRSLIVAARGRVSSVGATTALQATLLGFRILKRRLPYVRLSRYILWGNDALHGISKQPMLGRRTGRELLLTLSHHGPFELFLLFLLMLASPPTSVGRKKMSP